MPLLKNPQAAWDRPAITTHGRGNHAVRSEQYRYIRYADGTEELYEYVSDPNEWTNRAADPALAAVKADLARRLPAREASPVPGSKSRLIELRDAPYDFAGTLEAAARGDVGAVLSSLSPEIFRERARVAQTALHQRLPAAFPLRV